MKKIKYGKLYIRWMQIVAPKYKWKIFENWRENKKLDCDDSTYLSLIENFKVLGFLVDADNLYYSYRVERRKYLPQIYKLFDRILWLSYGYSVKPMRPLIWFLVAFVVFTLLYAAAPGAIGITKAFSPVDAFNTSLTILLAGSQLIVTPTFPASGMLPYWIFTIEKLFGSLFLALFLISIGRTIIRCDASTQ